jgi:hypothetical protein
MHCQQTPAAARSSHLAPSLSSFGKKQQWERSSLSLNTFQRVTSCGVEQVMEARPFGIEVRGKGEGGFGRPASGGVRRHGSFLSEDTPSHTGFPIDIFSLMQNVIGSLPQFLENCF